MGTTGGADYAAADICMSTEEVQEPSTSHAVSSDPLSDTAHASGQRLDLLNGVRLLNEQMEKVLAPKALGREGCCFSEDKISSIVTHVNTGAAIQVNAEPLVKCPHLPAKRIEDNEVPSMEVPDVESVEAGSCRIKRFRRGE
ncbi:hypothetical protein M514_04928 [Trichuris suis]|uniref:Uncharacterized protein n=1 Tax=Trichuris suis TaxID=68888 RepID=A0A085NP32_9BILA|nr:hypothetical protein M514_04928 [Trichuris suis]